MVECVVRMAYIYLERGCGCWVLLRLWNTLYQLFHVPARIVKAAVAVARQEGDDPLALPAIPKADADSVEKGDGQGGPGGGPPAFATLGARPKGPAPPVPPAYSVPRRGLSAMASGDGAAAMPLLARDRYADAEPPNASDQPRP